jgi:hypothetical protein
MAEGLLTVFLFLLHLPLASWLLMFWARLLGGASFSTTDRRTPLTESARTNVLRVCVL